MKSKKRECGLAATVYREKTAIRKCKIDSQMSLKGIISNTNRIESKQQCIDNF